MFATEDKVTATHSTDDIDQVQAQAGTWRDEFARLEREAPGWVADFNETDPFIASKGDVQRLIDTAPDSWARGLVMGIDMLRVQIELVSGRAYSQSPQGV